MPFFHLLGWRKAAIAYVKQHGGSEQDGEEVASDALLAFDRSLRNDQFRGASSLKTYFLSIAKRRWWKMLQSRRPDTTTPPEFIAGDDDNVEALFIKEEFKEVFNQALALAGERCKRIFEMVMLEMSMAEIALAMHLDNAHMAKKAAYRCRMAMREFLQTHPAWLTRLK